MKKHKRTTYGLVVTCRGCGLSFAPVLVYAHLASCKKGRTLRDR